MFNNKATLLLCVLLAAVCHAQIINPGGGGAPALNTVTGSAAQATITETSTSKQITFAGVETVALTYPYVVTNASNSNNTSGALIVAVTGTGTAQVPLALNVPATDVGNFWELWNGGTVTNGVLSGGTKEAYVSTVGLGSFAAGVQTGTSPPTCTVGTGGTACFTNGTAPTAAAGVSQIYGDSTLNDLAATSNGGGNELVRLTKPGGIKLRTQTASVTTATLCASSAGACDQAGQYHIHFDFWGSGTACSSVTAGKVTLSFTWTDVNSVAHSAVIPQLFTQTSATATAIGSAFLFQTALANESATGDLHISTNGTIIQYATVYTACTTGTGTYNLDITVDRLQ